MGTVGYTIGIDVHEAAISFNAGINKSLITPGNSRVGDENVKPATKVFEGSCDGFVHLFVGGDIDFVRLAYWLTVLARVTVLHYQRHLTCDNTHEEKTFIHFTLKDLLIFSDSAIAALLLLYQMATLAPASAKAWATARPIPWPAPDIMAVFPVKENNGMTAPLAGGTVLLRLNTPFFMLSAIVSDMLVATAVTTQGNAGDSARYRYNRPSVLNVLGHVQPLSLGLLIVNDLYTVICALASFDAALKII